MIIVKVDMAVIINPDLLFSCICNSSLVNSFFVLEFVIIGFVSKLKIIIVIISIFFILSPLNFMLF